MKLSTAHVARALGVSRPSDEHVRVSDRMIGELSKQVAARFHRYSYTPFTWDDPLFWNAEASRSERSQFFAIGNAINFRFWSLRDGRVIPASGRRHGQEFRGAMYMWRCLRLALDSGIPILDPSFLTKMREADFDDIFRSDDGTVPLEPGRDERIANLRDLGARLLRDWRGQFVKVIDTAEGSLIKFAHISRDFRAFDDPVYKLTMVNAILHSGSRVAEFKEEPLPGIDYHLLKQLLRHGVLHPSPEIGVKLINKTLLTADEGLALRKAALWAFVEISKLSGVSGELLDNLWWQNRTKCTDPVPICNTDRASECPFLGPCQRLVSYELPLEITRYY